MSSRPVLPSPQIRQTHATNVVLTWFDAHSPRSLSNPVVIGRNGCCLSEKCGQVAHRLTANLSDPLQTEFRFFGYTTQRVPTQRISFVIPARVRAVACILVSVTRAALGQFRDAVMLLFLGGLALRTCTSWVKEEARAKSISRLARNDTNRPARNESSPVVFQSNVIFCQMSNARSPLITWC